MGSYGSFSGWPRSQQQRWDEWRSNSENRGAPPPVTRSLAPFLRTQKRKDSRKRHQLPEKQSLLDSGDNLLAHWIHGRHDKMSSVINTRLGFGRYEQRLAPQLPIAHPLRVAPRRTKGTIAPLPPYLQPVATLGDSRWWGPLPNAKRRKSCHGACLLAATIQLAQAVATNGSSGPPPVTPSFSVC